MKLRKNAVAITLFRVMRRFFFVLLLLVLPVQAVWAAASSYCQHEQGTATSHFGHHAHAHKAAGKGDLGSGPASAFHADCAFCHLAGVGASTPQCDVPISASSSMNVPAPGTAFLSIFLEGPERPKWVAAV